MTRSILIATFSLALAACGGPGPGPGEFTADFKTNSGFFTKMSAALKGTSPHGTAQIWYSSNVKGLIDGTAFAVP
jgi:hypothetical protein